MLMQSLMRSFAAKPRYAYTRGRVRLQKLSGIAADFYSLAATSSDLRCTQGPPDVTPPPPPWLAIRRRNSLSNLPGRIDRLLKSERERTPTDYKAGTRNISKYETTLAKQKRLDENARAVQRGGVAVAARWSPPPFFAGPQKTYRGDKTASGGGGGGCRKETRRKEQCSRSPAQKRAAKSQKMKESRRKGIQEGRRRFLWERKRSREREDGWVKRGGGGFCKEEANAPRNKNAGTKEWRKEAEYTYIIRGGPWAPLLPCVFGKQAKRVHLVYTLS